MAAVVGAAMLGGCATGPNTSASMAPPKNYRQQVVAKVRESEVQLSELLYVGITQPKQMWTGIQNGGTRPAVCVQVERANIFGVRAAWFYLFFFENGKVDGYKLGTPSPVHCQPPLTNITGLVRSGR
jgi:hypothetical protein